MHALLLNELVHVDGVQNKVCGTYMYRTLRMYGCTVACTCTVVHFTWALAVPLKLVQMGYKYTCTTYTLLLYGDSCNNYSMNMMHSRVFAFDHVGVYMYKLTFDC